LRNALNLQRHGDRTPSTTLDLAQVALALDAELSGGILKA
jgi:hypothetical protein